VADFIVVIVPIIVSARPSAGHDAQLRRRRCASSFLNDGFMLSFVVDRYLARAIVFFMARGFLLLEFDTLSRDLAPRSAPYTIRYTTPK
jgi:hypothetical protein